MKNKLYISKSFVLTFVIVMNIVTFGSIASSDVTKGSSTAFNNSIQLKALNELLYERLITKSEYDLKKIELILIFNSTATVNNTDLLDVLNNTDAPQQNNIANKTAPQNKFIKYQGTDYLTFDELKTLYFNTSPEKELEEKTYKFFRTPIISNEAYYAGKKPHDNSDPRIGPFIRVASWNIEKSLNIKEAIEVLTSKYELLDKIDTKKVGFFTSIDTILKQREKLISADIIILQEMEIGIKRSGYLNAAKELADTLEMNYTYAPQYLEIDPVQLGIDNPFANEDEHNKEFSDEFIEHKKLYKGVFGSAVLSRYPIKNVVVYPLKNQGYDWYTGEKIKTTFIEESKRLGAKLAFKNEITREVKKGGRHFFRIDLEVPEIPGKTLTVINIHLEIKCLPKAREKQIEEILSYIKDIKNPVVVMGDFNSAPTDLSPTSITKEMTSNLKNPGNWLNTAVSTFTGVGLLVNTTRGLTNTVKNLQNPLAPNIPVIAPNKVKQLFSMVEDFRFSDGGAFDFRGDAKRSVNGKKSKLANSNQKDLKAFKTSFRVKRVIAKVIGTFRLDWVFVKSYLKDPLQEDGPYRLAPHFGETLSELNNSLAIKISDHDPNVVDLPLFETPQKLSALLLKP